MDAGEASLLERPGDLVALEQPHAARSLDHRLERPEGELAADRGHQRDPPAGGEHPSHLVERRERVAEQVQGGKAADGVEARVDERQRGRVAADEHQVVEAGAPQLGGAALEHRPRGVDADDEAVGADRAGELAREVAGTAGDVEHGVPLAEPEQQPGDPDLLRHPRAR